MKLIRFSIGADTFALPHTAANLAKLIALLGEQLFVERYTSSKTGDYSRVFVHADASLTVADCNVFEGTLEEYRKRPATHADLVVQLSAANDQIAELTQQLNAATQPFGEVEAAE